MVTYEKENWKETTDISAVVQMSLERMSQNPQHGVVAPLSLTPVDYRPQQIRIMGNNLQFTS